MTQDLQAEINKLRQEILTKDVAGELSKAGFEDPAIAAKLFISENPGAEAQQLTSLVEEWKRSPIGKRFLKPGQISSEVKVSNPQKTTTTPQAEATKPLTAKELSSGLKNGTIKLKVN